MIDAACRTGDQRTLEILFRELNIGPDHPREPWDFDISLAMEQRTPTINSMFHTALTNKRANIVEFLCSAFPNNNMDCGPLVWAVETGDIQLVEAICKVDPAATNGAYGYRNTLAIACEKPENAEIVRMLLKYGADPNRPAEHTPPWSNAGWAIIGNMPASTFEDFFDYGYRFDDPWAVRFAVSHKRLDVLEVLFARGKTLPTACLVPKDELIKLAMEDNSLEIADFVEREYPRVPGRAQNRVRGLVNCIARMLRPARQ